MNAERETSLLSTFLNTKSQHSNPQIVRTRLANYLQMLSMTGSRVFLNVAIRSVACAFCGGRANFGVEGVVTLQCCQGKVCGSNCFRWYVYSATGNTLCNLESVQCRKCQNYIGKSMCLSYFTEWEIYTNSQKQAVTVAAASPTVFTCCIHMDEVPESERVRLSCSHEVCRECIEGHIEAKLNEGKSDLKCPTNGCSADISESLVRQLTPKLFRRYEALTFEAAKSALTQEQEVLFNCPTANCPYLAVVPITLFDFTCVMCNHRYCPQCKDEAHPSLTCAQHLAFLQAEVKRQHVNSQAEKDTEAFFAGKADRGMRQCPKCKVWIERMEGCKYMTCESPTCQGKTYFCITCGRLLKKKHGKHDCTVEGYDFL